MRALSLGENERIPNYSSGSPEITRVKVRQRKKTVGITLPRNVVKRARKHRLNISRITEQALLSILDYLETQNNRTSSKFLNERSFLKESSVVPRGRLELPTTRSSASPSNRLLSSRVLSQSELPRPVINMTRTFIFKFSEDSSYWSKLIA